MHEGGFLSCWVGERGSQRAIFVIGTSNTPFDIVVENSSNRDVSIDAPLPILWEMSHKPIEPSHAMHQKDGGNDYGTAMLLSEDLNTDSKFAEVDAVALNTSTT